MKKFSWRDKCGNFIRAGGIFFYDETGFWFAKELIGNTVYFNDFGGKYDLADGDIYATVVREFREETYNTCEIPYKRMKELSKMYSPLYAENERGKKVYVSYCIDMDDVDIDFNHKKFFKSRQKVLRENKSVPRYYYSTLSVCHVSYENLSQYKKKMAPRLKSCLESILTF